MALFIMLESDRSDSNLTSFTIKKCYLIIILQISRINITNDVANVAYFA